MGSIVGWVRAVKRANLLTVDELINSLNGDNIRCPRKNSNAQSRM
jgi:hypothetical protein